MKLGYEIKSGEPVDVPVTHSVVSALTGGGKTEAILRLMHEAEVAGYTVLALDVKAKPRDFEGVGHEIRPFISESTEPLLVLRMLESVAGAGLFSRFSVILDASMDTKRLQDVHTHFEEIRDNKKLWSRKRDDAKVLGYLAGKLLDQVQEGNYAPDIRLTTGKINVMDLSSLPLGVQQLVVDSVFRWLLAHERKVILVLEEAINFIPQMEKVQFETSARKFIREGRSAGLWLWASGQALTEMDIHIRKQMRAWILGGQMEENEAAKFMRQVPMKGIKPEEVQKLPTGHFIAAIRRTEEEGGKVEVKHVYVQPTWLPDHAAVKVAKGEWTLTNAMQFKKARPKKVVDTKEEERIEKLKAEIAEKERRLKELADEVRSKEKYLMEKMQALRVREEGLKEDAAELSKREKDNMKSLAKTMHDGLEVAAKPDSSTQYNLNVDVEVPELTLKVRKVMIEATDRDNIGRLGILVADGFLDSSRTIPDLQKEFRMRGWGKWSGGAGKVNMTKAATKFAIMGFVRIDGDTVMLVPGVKSRIKEA